MESKNLIVIIYINLEQDNQVAKLFEYFGTDYKQRTRTSEF